MIKKVKFTLPLLLLSVIQIGYSQVLFRNEKTLDLIDMIDFRERIDRYVDVDGSPYMNDEFIEGNIYYNNEFRYADIPLRYNIFNDDMEFKFKGSVLAMEPYQPINKIVIAEDTFIISDYMEGKQLVKGYFELLEEGKADLIKQLNVKFEEAEPAKPFFAPKPARFVREKPTYYIRVKNAIPQKVRGIKRLIRTIGDKEEKLLEYARENRISRGNIKEIEKLVAYYNSLE